MPCVGKNLEVLVQQNLQFPSSATVMYILAHYPLLYPFSTLVYSQAFLAFIFQ